MTPPNKHLDAYHKALGIEIKVARIRSENTLRGIEHYLERSGLPTMSFATLGKLERGSVAHDWQLRVLSHVYRCDLLKIAEDLFIHHVIRKAP